MSEGEKSPSHPLMALILFILQDAALTPIDGGGLAVNDFCRLPDYASQWPRRCR